jgi:hypothetical protein
MNELSQREYTPFYSGYIQHATSRSSDLLNLMIENKKETIDFFKGIPKEKHLYSYADKKWTILEFLQHLLDW